MVLFYKAKSNVFIIKKSGGLILFDAKASKVKLLNETGYFIWKCLAKKSSSEKIIDALAKNYPRITRRKLGQDLRGFLASMSSYNLISTFTK